MAWKRSVCAFVVLAILLTCIPIGVSAVGPTLASGTHVKWIDRIADLPDYARSFYSWLEANSGTTGALADPTKATYLDGCYVHQVHELKGTLSVSASVSESQVQSLIMDAVSDEAQVATDYVFEVYGAFDRDHPEVFWLETESRCGMNLHYSFNRQTCSVTYDLDILFYLTEPGFDIRLEGYRTASSIAAGISKRDADIRRILDGCPVNSSVAEQVRYLNRVLTQTNAYNSAESAGLSGSADPMAWKCVSALAGSAGASGPVCEGYARAFKVLCDRLGIPCVLTEGYARSSKSGSYQAHMWNYVCVEGVWYAVDVTWNDPRVAGNENAAQSGKESEQYLLVGGMTSVANGLTWNSAHQVRNVVYSGSNQYVNGPVLSASAYRFPVVEQQPEVPEEPNEPPVEPINPENPQQPEQDQPQPGETDEDHAQGGGSEADTPLDEYPENYLDVSPYRSTSSYLAPSRPGYVFAGWFVDEALTIPLGQDVTRGYAYASFVSEQLLTVRCQIAEGTDHGSDRTDLRLIAGIPSLQLQGVVFETSLEQGTVAGSAVYEQLLAGDTAIAPAELFGSDAKYLIIGIVADISSEQFMDEITIVPGWITLDGTYVAGRVRTLRVSDGI